MVPVFRSTGWDAHIMIDCAPPGASYPRPVAYATSDAIESHALQAVSLLALLETWVVWFDADLITWNNAEGRWEHDEDALDWTTYRAGFF